MSVYLKIIPLILSVFLIRPSAMGEQFTSVALVLILFSAFIQLLEWLKYRNKFSISKKNLIVTITCLGLWTFLLMHALIQDSNNLEFVLKATISHMIVISIGAIILSHQRTNLLFFKGLIKVFIFFSFSYCITFFLTMVLGIEFEKLLLFKVPVEGYESSGDVYFPFTQLYGFMTVGDIRLPRVLGFFRESGIFQAFLIWAYFNLKQYGLNNKKNKALLLIGIVGTFSTAGIAVFFAVYAFKLFLTRKKFLSIFLVIISVFGLIYAPFIGLESKSVTHESSITDRSFAMKDGVNRMMENPIGTGLYNAEWYDSRTSSINLIAMSKNLGVFGLTFVLLTYFLPAAFYEYRRSYLIGVMPFFLTLLLSQPILDAPIVYLIMLANYGNTSRANTVTSETTKLMPYKNKKVLRMKKYKITW